MTSTIRVALGDRSYDIRIAAGLLDQAGSLLRPVLTIPRVYVVTDENVEKWHLDQLTSSLDGAGIENHGVVMPAGEHTKGFPHLESLIDGMLEAGCARDTTVIAFGGGVIGDLAGFAAGIFMRGIPFVQIPTTLLAQVDSSVGGKTAINTRQGKNLVGCFYQPRLVLADLNVLDTLPLRELRSGYGEIVKYGLIDDPAFFDWLDDHAADVMNGDVAARQYAVSTSCAAKARIVAADEREAGQRALLNLGHTFAHALEAETGFGERLHHGEAVSIGSLMAFELSARMGLCPPADVMRLRQHLEKLSMPVSFPVLEKGRKWQVDRLFSHFAKDKKVKNSQLTFVLARGIGKSFLCRDVPSDILRDVLAEWVNDAP